MTQPKSSEADSLAVAPADSLAGAGSVGAPSVFHLLTIHQHGYSYRQTVRASDVQEAAQKHVEAYVAARGPVAIVMRASSGRRYSVEQSRALIR